jgi:hypothetical protein
MAMRYLNRYLGDIDGRATQIVKTIGDVYGVLVYSAIVGLLLYAAPH